MDYKNTCKTCGVVVLLTLVSASECSDLICEKCHIQRESHILEEIYGPKSSMDSTFSSFSASVIGYSGHSGSGVSETSGFSGTSHL